MRARDVPGLFAIAAAVALAVLGARARAPQVAPPTARSIRAPRPAPPPARPPDHVRWIAIGGGSAPELNQLSLEDDLLGVRDVLGEGGVVLFAGGRGTRSVQVEDGHERGEPLRRALGDLVAGRGGRDARYQEARLEPDGAATGQAVADALSFALADGDAPLLLWVAAHGDRGELPADASVLLWAGGALTPADLERIVTESDTDRMLRMVITSCYAGGFAELALADLDPARGPTTHALCGLFATRWDVEAAGCDPSPDRAAQEAYSIHLIEALRGRDRRGRDARAEIDLDADGAITLLEAHARARAEALTFEIPTTTSTRLLRAIAPAEGPGEPFALPEEELIVRTIGARLRLADEADARARLDALVARRIELEALREAREQQSDDLWWAVVGELLSRWPVIDDPWHPDFEPTLAREGARIRAFLDQSPERAAWLDAEEDLAAIEHTLAALGIQAAPIERWLEAQETIALAARLRATGGDGWARYLRMRACEATAP